MALPHLVVCFDERRALRDAGVVDEDVGAAAEPLARHTERALDALAIRHVARGVCGRDAALVRNGARRALDLGGGARDQCDQRPLARERQPDGATDAAPAARHESDSVGEKHE